MHPHLLQFGHLILPTYGVLLALGLVVSLLLCLYTARLLALDRDKVWNLALLAIVVTIAGAKLLLAAANWRHDGPRAFWLSLNGASGALICGVAIALAACWFYAWRVQLPVRRTADAVAPALCLANAFASIACFEAGCAFGTPTRVPWAVVYSSPFADPATPLGVPLHPTQLYFCAMEFAIFVLLLWMLHRPHRDGEIMGLWLFLSGMGSFFLGFLRGDSGAAEILGGAITISQAIATVMVLTGGFLWLHRVDRREALYAG